MQDGSLAQIEDHFDVRDFVGMWPAISAKYEFMKFSDPLTDVQRIEEFSYIHEQLCKFISKKKTTFLKYADDPKKMQELVQQTLGSAKEKSLVRKELVYIALRDEWLVSLYTLLDMIIMEKAVEDDLEEENDEWI